MAPPCCGAGGNLRWGRGAGDHPGVPAGAGGSHPRGLRSAGVSHQGFFFTFSPPPTPAGTHVLAHACMHARTQHEATCIALSYCRSCPVPARSARHVLRLLLRPPGGAVARQQSDGQVLASAATLCCGRCGVHETLASRPWAPAAVQAAVDLGGELGLPGGSRASHHT